MNGSSLGLLGASILLLGACGGSIADGDASAGAGGSTSTGSSTAATGGTGGGTGSEGGACAGPAAKACSDSGECVLTAPSCCLCGTPEIGDFVAVNVAEVGSCACDGPVCGCATMIIPNLAASCDEGACAAWDVRQRDEYSKCTDGSECRLRFGLGCCEPTQGSEWDLVAVRTDAEPILQAAMCTPADACPSCLPTYPGSKAAACVEGHCQVVDTGAGGASGGCD